MDKIKAHVEELEGDSVGEKEMMMKKSEALVLVIIMMDVAVVVGVRNYIGTCIQAETIMQAHVYHHAFTIIHMNFTKIQQNSSKSVVL